MRGTPEEARDDALRMLEGRGGAGPHAGLTPGEALEAILRDGERREATAGFYRSHLGALVRHFGADRRFSTLAGENVREFVDARRRQGANGLTIKRDLEALTRAVRLAGLKGNPALDPRLVRPCVQRRHPGLRPAWAEVRAVLRRLSELADRGGRTPSGPLAVPAFVAGTGVRHSEFARMRRADLDLVGDRIVVPVGKTEPREPPLPKVPSA